jgi:hypothetical protein
MSQLPKVQENNEQILNDIQSLQQLEQKLFNSLETNPNLSTEEQKKMIEKMNQISNMRINQYETLSGVNNYFQNALDSSVDSLKQQLMSIEIVEDELNRAKKRLEILEEEKNNKIRLVEVNTYFGDKYAEHSQLMKIIIFTLIPVIIITFIYGRGFLPNTIYYALLVLISIIGAYFFWSRFSSIIMRDNMNYQEYEWPFDRSGSTGTPSAEDPWLGGNFGTCLGNACCSEGLVYDSELNQCIPDTNKKEDKKEYKKESFVNGVLTKMQPGNYKLSYDLNEPKPFNN